MLLLTCSISWCQSDTTCNKVDSVLVPVEALRIANAKMIELNYEKQINKELKEAIKTDSVLIDALQTNVNACESQCNDNIKKVKKQRNIAIGAGSGASALLLLLLIVLL